MMESAAIVEHLCDRHGGTHFVPTPGTDAHIRHRELLHFAEGSAMTPILLRPKLSAFVAAMHVRPAWQIAREKGGAYYGF